MNEIEKLQKQKTEKHTYTVQGKTDKAPAVNNSRKMIEAFYFCFVLGFCLFMYFGFVYCYIVGDIVSLAFSYLFFSNLIVILFKLLYFLPNLCKNW
jgi:hypothetical protein